MGEFDITGLVNELLNYAVPNDNTSSRVPFTKNPEAWKSYYTGLGFTPTDNIHDIDQQENNDYTAFTNLIVKEPNKYQDYINALYKATTRDGINDKMVDAWSKFSQKNNQGNVTITNTKLFKDWYEDGRTDGDFGPMHYTARKITGGQPGTVDGNNAVSPGNNDIQPAGTSVIGENPLFMMDNIILEGGNNENTEEDPFLINPVLKKEFKKTHPWLLPQLAGYYNEARTARNVAREKKKGLSIPEVTPKKKYAKTTDAYFSRTELEKEARRLEQQAATPLYSDPVAQDKYKESLLKQAVQLRKQALALREEEFQITKKETNAARDYNSNQAIDAANLKSKYITALKERIANINAEEQEKLGSITSNAIDSIATSIQQAAYTNKLNKHKVDRQYDIDLLTNDINNLQKQYDDLYKASIFDDEESKKKFNAISHKYSDDLSLAQNANPKFTIQDLYESKKSTDSDIQKIYDAFETRKKQQLSSIANRIINLERSKQYLAQETPYISNTPQLHDNFWNGVSKLFTLKKKSGGEITKAEIQAAAKRFDAIQRSKNKHEEIYYKQQRDAYKNLHEREKIAQRSLDKALDRLSREDILLLKSILS